MSLIDIYFAAVLHVFAVPALLHPIVYRRVRWWSGATGKALMNMARSIGLIFVLLVVHFWWHDLPGYPLLKSVLFTYLGCSITYQLVVMQRLQRRGRQHQQFQMEGLPQ